MAVIETKGLTKTYIRDFIDVEHGRLKIRFRDRKIHALEDLTLNIEEGEIFGLLGHNGAGKTTTLKILTGIHFATSGSANMLGRPVGDPEARRRLGFLPENPSFYDYLRGWEFLEFYGRLYGLPKAIRRQRIEELLERVGLTHARNLPIRGYSKGMNQRIGLAQALLNDPDLVILDEPQSGLDPLGRKAVRDLILDLRRLGKTVLFSSHILQDAELICDRVAVLNRGRLTAVGPLNDLLSARVRQWEVVTEGGDPGQFEMLRPRIKEIRQTAIGRMAVVENEALADEIIRSTLGSGGRVISVTPHKQTLEEYFIEELEGDRAA